MEVLTHNNRWLGLPDREHIRKYNNNLGQPGGGGGVVGGDQGGNGPAAHNFPHFDVSISRFF